jgi:hypothetical protein
LQYQKNTGYSPSGKEERFSQVANRHMAGLNASVDNENGMADKASQ